MGSIYARGGRLYCKVKDVTGRWIGIATGLRLDQRDEAKKFLAERERVVTTHLATAGTGPMTLRRYVLAWLDRRNTASVNDDRTRLDRHVLPRLGDVLLAASATNVRGPTTPSASSPLLV